MCEGIVNRLHGALPSMAELRSLADGDPDYELFAVRLKQLETLLRARAQIIMARMPQERLDAQVALDKARDLLTGAL